MLDMFSHMPAVLCLQMQHHHHCHSSLADVADGWSIKEMAVIHRYNLLWVILRYMGSMNTQNLQLLSSELPQKSWHLIFEGNGMHGWSVRSLPDLGIEADATLVSQREETLCIEKEYKTSDRRHVKFCVCTDSLKLASKWLSSKYTKNHALGTEDALSGQVYYPHRD